MVKDHVAHDLLDVPAGIGVVADQCNAVRRQLRGADVEDLILNRGRHPSIDAMTNNVVELSKVRVDIQDVHDLEPDVGQSLAGSRFLSLRDLCLGQVEAHESTTRQSSGHRNQTASDPTTQVPYP